MKNFILAFLFPSLYFLNLSNDQQLLLPSQSDTVVARFREEYPQEKVFLQTDRSYYVAGETMWMKAWCTTENQPSFLSRILYVDLVNNKGEVVEKKMYKLDSLSTTPAFLDIPKVSTTGNYSVNAYTLWMLNFPEFVFRKNVFIYGEDFTQANKKRASATSSIKLNFFAEGGDIIGSVKNRIAFKATDAKGFPVAVSGAINDKSGAKVADITTLHDGMGAFELLAKDEEQYTAVLSSAAGNGLSFKLPAVKTEGVAVRVENTNPNRLFVLLERSNNNKAKYGKLKVTAQTNYQVVFNTDLNLDEDQVAASIPKKNLPAGIMQITVFTADGAPIAERLAYIENQTLEAPNVSLDVVDTKRRGLNKYSFSLNNPDKSSLSVLVSNAAYVNPIYKDENIASSLLLSSDIVGYIHNPGYYFKDKNPETLQHLDLLLMTQGWRRFDWKKLTAGQFPAIKYPVESAITISGKVNKSGRNELVKEGQVAFVIKGEDSTSILADARLTDKGEFLLTDLDYRKKATIAYQGTNNKKEKLIVDVLLNSSYIDTLKKSLYKAFIDLDTTDISNRKDPLSNYIYTQISLLDKEGLNDINYLGNVTVRTKARTKIDSLVSEYVTDIYEDSDQTLVMDDKPYFNIWQYLQRNIAGLQVTPSEPNGGSVGFTRHMGADAFSEVGADSLRFFVNEVPVSNDVVDAIRPEDVALIKVYKGNLGFILGANRGAIAIYTKKGTTSKTPFEKTFSKIERLGYTIVREFYSPDYSNPEVNATETDKRATLYWNGSIKPASDGKYHVKFYNNDIATKLKLTIQGIDAKGRLIHYEKILE